MSFCENILKAYNDQSHAEKKRKINFQSILVKIESN